MNIGTNSGELADLLERGASILRVLPSTDLSGLEATYVNVPTLLFERSVHTPDADETRLRIFGLLGLRSGRDTQGAYFNQAVLPDGTHVHVQGQDRHLAEPLLEHELPGTLPEGVAAAVYEVTRFARNIGGQFYSLRINFLLDQLREPQPIKAVATGLYTTDEMRDDYLASLVVGAQLNERCEPVTAASPGGFRHDIQVRGHDSLTQVITFDMADRRQSALDAMALLALETGES